MISISKPVSGEDFINRVDLLKKLHSTYPIDNVALVGPRRMGKSSIAEQFLLTLKQKNAIKFRFDVQENMGTPGKFAIRLLRSFLKSYFDQFTNFRDSELDEIEVNPAVLVDFADRIKSKTLNKLSRFLVTYFPPSPENERAVLERILHFLDDFSSEMNAKAVVVLDEFQDIVDLNRFKGFGNGKILGFLQGIISGQKNVWYLFTGSAVRIMIDILEGGRAPFYGRVIRFNVTPFNRDDTAALVYKCTDKPVTDEALNLIYALSNGHPFYTRVIISAAEKISDNDVIVTRHDIEEAFITELFGGTLDSHCKYLFESSLARLEKKGTFLKEILRELSAGEESVTELSQKVGRKTGNLSLALRNLHHLDLIEKIDKKYHISDPIMGIWLRTVYGHNEPKLDIIRKNISKNYEEYIASLSTETGIFFESYMREMLQRFKGQRYKDIRLPKFNVVQGLNSYDKSGEVFGKPSNIEIDALCQGEETWICEFKYRKRSVNEKDIEILHKKRKFIEKKLSLSIHRMVYIARSGFSEGALNSDVLCLTFERLNDLLSVLNMKKISYVFSQNKQR